jgi:hypothetical protein
VLFGGRVSFVVWEYEGQSGKYDLQLPLGALPQSQAEEEASFFSRYEEQMDISGIEIPLPPPKITIADILASQEVILQTEASHKALLDGIGQMDLTTLRNKLVLWGTAGFPNVYVIHEVAIAPPPVCSDGVSRDLASYITFCSGKTIQEHIALLQDLVDDIAVSFSYTGSSVQIVVSKV